MARNKYPELTVEHILDVSSLLFMENGYDDTSIQDIVNALKGLSKGAIYHHFKSKEEILWAVFERISAEMDATYVKIKADKTLTGIEKLRKIFTTSLQSPEQESLVKALPDILKNSKILAMQINCTINEIVPQIIQPIIEQGVADGSIKTQYPKELGEVMMLLGNLWINPFMFSTTKDELYSKFCLYRQIMEGLGICIFDDEMLDMIEHLREIKES